MWEVRVKGSKQNPRRRAEGAIAASPLGTPPRLTTDRGIKPQSLRKPRQGSYARLSLRTCCLRMPIQLMTFAKQCLLNI